MKKKKEKKDDSTLQILLKAHQKQGYLNGLLAAAKIATDCGQLLVRDQILDEFARICPKDMPEGS